MESAEREREFGGHGVFADDRIDRAHPPRAMSFAFTTLTLIPVHVTLANREIWPGTEAIINEDANQEQRKNFLIGCNEIGR